MILKGVLAIFLAVCVSILNVPAQAASGSGIREWAVGGWGGSAVPVAPRSFNRDVDSGGAGGAILEWRPFRSGFGLAMTYDVLDFKDDVTTDAERTNAHAQVGAVSLIASGPPEWILSPSLSLGAGIGTEHDMETSRKSGGVPVVRGGIGLEHFFSDRLSAGVWVMAHYFVQRGEDAREALVASPAFAARFRFGSAERRRPRLLARFRAARLRARLKAAALEAYDPSEDGDRKFARTQPAKDGDKDGVPDDWDVCPDTRFGGMVDDWGCPADDDKDSVPNDRDLCSGTPYRARVDLSGCPADADADGVHDGIDACPGSPDDRLVDEDGCTLPDKISIEVRVTFEPYSVQVEQRFLPELKRVSEFLERNENAVGTIEGHTDNLGSHELNMELSTKRAHNIRRVLVEMFNVSPDRLDAVGYGPTRPVASNDTPTGRARNRRVIASFRVDDETPSSRRASTR